MLKLGKRPPRHDARTLKLARYLPERLPIPPAIDWSQFAVKPWPMYQNDVIGDCFFASAAHLVHAWSAADKREQVIAERDVLGAYADAAGFDRKKPETDVGIDMLTGMKWWRKVGIGGHKIGAFASIDAASRPHMRAAVAIFGGFAIGFALPREAEWRPWTFTPGKRPESARGSWDGHACAVVGYGEQGLLVVTWGGIRLASWGFVGAYTDEAIVAISEDFLGPDGLAPNGLDLAALRADLARVSSASPATWR